MDATLQLKQVLYQSFQFPTPSYPEPQTIKNHYTKRMQDNMPFDQNVLNNCFKQTFYSTVLFALFSGIVFQPFPGPDDASFGCNASRAAALSHPTCGPGKLAFHNPLICNCLRCG
jgi:hypothetical protein